MPEYKLQYFNLKARAELPRLMFAEAGVKYEDVRVEYEEWPKIKPTTPFGQLPVLFIDGKPLPQSGAIVRYLAREFQLNGGDSVSTAYVDMIVETLGDMGSKLPFIESDAEKKAELAKKAIDTNIKPNFTKMEAKFKEVGTDFLVGEKLTYADLAMLGFTQTITLFDKTFMDDFPTMKALSNRVAERPKIKEYLANRPATLF